MAWLQRFPKSQQFVKKRTVNASCLNVGYRPTHDRLLLGLTMELRFRAPADTRWVMVTWILSVVYMNNQLDALFSFSYWVITPLHVSGVSAVHHLEVKCVYVANGTCCTSELTVSGPGSLTVHDHMQSVLGEWKIRRWMLEIRELLLWSMFNEKWEFLDQISDCHSLKKDSFPRR
jgi:hypothetical protein